MAARFTASSVISYFAGDDAACLGEVVCDGSDDDLGMEDLEYEHDQQPGEVYVTIK